MPVNEYRRESVYQWGAYRSWGKAALSYCKAGLAHQAGVFGGDSNRTRGICYGLAKRICVSRWYARRIREGYRRHPLLGRCSTATMVAAEACLVTA